MKTYIAILPIFLALTAAPSIAYTATDAPSATVAAKVELRARFNAMVDELAAKAAARGATREDFSKVVEEIRAVANEYMDAPRVAGIRERAIARMNELEVKAKAAALQLMEFDAFKDLLIDLDLQGIFNRTIERARAGEVTRLQWTMYKATLQQRADSAKAWNPELDAIIGRLMAECERIEKRAGEALKPKDLEPLEALHADVMVHATAARLSKRALQTPPGVIDPKGRYQLLTCDFGDVKEALVATGVPETADFMRKVQARLDEIRDAAAGGRITRAECDALCTLLLQRARAAATPG
jgi:hypothetical protein